MELKKHARISLAYFIIAALIGVLLRFFTLVDIAGTYKFILHAHSHIALLGWVYIGLTTLLYFTFINKPLLRKKYRIIFWFTQITILGMLIAFPLQGYALYSIIFSTLFLIASYWFTVFFLKNSPKNTRDLNSYKCAKAALLYMVISSIGPWALGVIMTTLGATSIWYRLSIYFYLHFQYNGWMILALIAVFLFLLEQKNIILPKKNFSIFFILINLGIVLTLFLSALWTRPSGFVYVLAAIGAVIQLIAMVYLAVSIRRKKKKFVRLFTSLSLIMFKVAIFLFGIKLLLQLISVFPNVVVISSTVLEFVIGYLHLTFLGVVSITLLVFLDYFKLLKISKGSMFLYLFGFISTEILIFSKGIYAVFKKPMLSSYIEILGVFSTLIAISLIMLFYTSIRK